MISEGKREDVIQALKNIAERCEQFGKGLKDDSSDSESLRISGQLIGISNLAADEQANIDQPFRLGVVGMFKSGKSSVINTFLNRLVLKEGRTETTSVLTELRFAETPEAETAILLFADGKSKEITIAEALHYTDIRSERFRDLTGEEKRALQESISRIVLHLNCELLRTVTLLDTPGFGGSQIGDQKAFEALAKVDAALMIFSADRTGAQNELEVADFLTSNGREIVVLLNKTDEAHGEMRREEDLAVAEAFIRENFQTIVRDRIDNPLIFRYSAKEVWKALEMIQQAGLSNDVQAQLGRWGYSETGETDAEKGVITFIRERYFSSASGAVYQRKLRAAQKSLLNALSPLLQEIDNARNTALEAEGEAKSEQAKRMRRLREEIEPKILHIEAKIEDIIIARVHPFVRDLEEAISAMMEKQTDLDMGSLFKSFRHKETIALEIERELRANFPEWRERMLLEDVERQINRLLKNEWMYVFDQVQKLDASLSLPDPTKILQEVNNAVRGFMITLAANIGGWIALIFIPGGAVVGVLLVVFSEFFGMHFASRRENKLKEAKNKVRVQMRNYAEELAAKMIVNARLANDKLADLARDSIKSDLQEIDLQAQAQRDLAERWRRLHRNIDSLYTTLEKFQIELL